MPAPSMFERIDQHPRLVLLAAILLGAVVWLLDQAAGPRVGLGLVYVIPLCLLTLSTGLRTGLGATVLVMGASGVLGAIALDGDGSLWGYVWELAGRAFACLAMIVLLHETQVAWRSQRELANSDALTGLPNRRAFLARAQQEMDRLPARHAPLTIAYLDCDGLKQVNDRFGHAAGDAVLQLIAAAGRRLLTGPQYLARLGGDEFVLLLPDTDASAAGRILAELEDTLEHESQGLGVGVSVSAGMETFTTPPESLARLMGGAEERMYVAKQAAKKVVPLYAAAHLPDGWPEDAVATRWLGLG